MVSASGTSWEGHKAAMSKTMRERVAELEVELAGLAGPEPST